jgi:hypothetical protein
LNGTVVSGRAGTEIDGLLKSAEMEWSIQDGAFQLLQLGTFLTGLAVHVSPDTGMVGSPSLGSDGILRVTTLLNYACTPGRQLFVESKALPPAFYRVTRTEAVGDRSGGDWYTRIEAEVLA